MLVSLCPCHQHTQTPHKPTRLFHDQARALGSSKSETGSSTNTLRCYGISIPWMGLRSDHVAWPMTEVSFSPLFSVAEKTEPKNKGKKRQKKPKTERHTGT